MNYRQAHSPPHEASRGGEYYGDRRTPEEATHDGSNTVRPITDFYRLFMVPGMGHCGGGAGPNTFDALSPLEAWVEKGIAPEQIIGSGNVAGDSSKKMTRPLCAYPNIARYKGTSDPNDAANFQCVAPTQR